MRLSRHAARSGGNEQSCQPAGGFCGGDSCATNPGVAPRPGNAKPNTITPLPGQLMLVQTGDLIELRDIDLRNVHCRA